MVSHVVFVDNDEGHIQDVLDAYPSTLFIKIDEERSNWPDCPSSRTIAKRSEGRSGSVRTRKKIFRWNSAY